jgi:hypothetical protein
VFGALAGNGISNFSKFSEMMGRVTDPGQSKEWVNWLMNSVHAAATAQKVL